MLNFLQTLSFIVLTIPIFGQSSFEYLLDDNKDHWPWSIVELNDNYIINVWQERTSTLIIKLDNNGSLIDSVGLYNPNGTCILGNLLVSDSNQIIGLGIYTIDTLEYLWFVKFDEELSIIEEKIHYIKDFCGYDLPAIINQEGNIIMATTIEKAFMDFKSCTVELNQNGEILLYKEFESPGMLQRIYDILEDTNNNLYKLIAYRQFEKSSSIAIINLDYQFDIFSQFVMWETGELNNAKWISQNRYVLSAKYLAKSYCDMKLLKMSDDDSEISSIIIGEEDFFENPGNVRNMDFIDPQDIFYAGMKGYTWPEPYLNFPNWLLLNKLDSTLNIEWQRKYGGDANYYLHTVLATSDGGFIMCSGRYDHNYQNEELDAYILKVDSDGLITNTSENEYNKEGLIIYPNPAKDLISFKTELRVSRVEIYNGLGQQILTYSGLVKSLNISQLYRGIYYVKVYTSDGTFFKKLIKQ